MRALVELAWCPFRMYQNCNTFSYLTYSNLFIIINVVGCVEIHNSGDSAGSDITPSIEDGGGRIQGIQSRSRGPMRKSP